MAGKTRQYVLIDNYKPVSWQVRNKALVFQEGKGLREIIYVRGGHSIWKDEYDKGIQLRSADLWFEDGTMLVNPTDVLLIQYLENHPDFGVKFKLDDPERDAEIELEAIERQDEVKDALSKLDDYDALCEAISGKNESTLHLTPTQKKLRCYQEASKDPEKVLKAIGDPATTVKYLVALALSKNIIQLNLNKTQVVWTDNKEPIVAMVLGQKPSDVMAEFLFEPKSEGTLAELQKRVLALDKPKAQTKQKKKSA